MPGDGDADAETLGGGIRGERAVRARVPRHEVAERVGERLEERGRDADGQRHAERIAQAPGVFDGGDRGVPAIVTGIARRGDRPARRAARRRRASAAAVGRPRLGRAAGAARDLGGVERAEDAQQVGDALDAARAALGVEALRLALELGDDVGVEQLAHLDLAEQLATAARDRPTARRRAARRGASRPRT